MSFKSVVFVISGAWFSALGFLAPEKRHLVFVGAAIGGNDDERYPYRDPPQFFFLAQKRPRTTAIATSKSSRGTRLKPFFYAAI